MGEWFNSEKKARLKRAERIKNTLWVFLVNEPVCREGLSPLLSNILLNELDTELTTRGHRFVRYADDCSIFLRSNKAAKRALVSITKFIEQKLKLKVNTEKTSICRPIYFHLLGYNFISTYKSEEKGQYRLRVSPERFKRMKQKAKEITQTRSLRNCPVDKSREGPDCRGGGPLSFTERLAELNSYLKGWIGYFRYAHMQGKLMDLDVWIRNRLRYCIWSRFRISKVWETKPKLFFIGRKTPNKRMQSYIRVGVPQGMAYAWSRSRMGGWAQARSPIMRTTVTAARLLKRGYIEFSVYYQRFTTVLNPPIEFRY